ncbi:recombinase RecT [Arthrobacter phage vB_ArtM-ArV1]|uniref:Recombinase RecT n=1 Tax=Arthrobacter phage vB_ArtM-ArV1 TaxID=1566993 RepID=A0A0A7HAW8_9CAUD|nr:RecT-like ssDNA annealing protein [Arthrobacter phage vB_ArtM-ArV1]AIZ01728.1 recombinase RecT [Arthrobacter phage vB_ArtM-ArV1]
MSTPAQERAVVVQDQVRGLLLHHRRQLTSTLPSHLKDKGDAWLSGALAALQRNPDLATAALNAPHTLVSALSEAAQKGLNPGTPEYYLTPRRNKGQDEILGITGYQGEIEMIFRAGAVATIVAEVVHEKDEYTYERGVNDRPIHKIPGGNFGRAADRGKMIGVYAYCIMKDGSVSRIIEHGEDHIEKVKAEAKGVDGQFSPWRKWPDQMWLKTAVHSLSKWVPTSAEYIREQHRAVAVGAATAVPESAKGNAGGAPSGDTPRPAPANINDDPNQGGQFEDLGERPNADTNTGETFENDPTAAAWGLGDPESQQQ